MNKTDAALAWAARGFRVFPLIENSAKPAWAGWTDTATTDAALIRAWWEGTDYNIGVCTTGMLVVDVDTKKGRPGLESWLRLGSFDTLTIRTRSGGYHLYYSGADVALNQGALGEGLDIRSHHGYVVAPGSVIDGAGYTVEIDAPVVPAPQHIVALCKPPRDKATNARDTLVDVDDDAAMILAADRVARTPGAVHGEQSQATYQLACAVRDFGVSEHGAATAMEEWAARCSPPIGPEDLRGIITNAYLYAQNAVGSKHPSVQFAGITIPPPPAPETRIEPPVIVSVSGFGRVRPLAELTVRPHVYHRLLMRRQITTLLAPGGVGKSLLMLTVAAHLAMGADCMGYKIKDAVPQNSIIYNAEDEIEEMEMRLHAICQTLGYDVHTVAARVCLLSGKSDGKLKLVRGGQSPEMDVEACKRVVALAVEHNVSVIGMDPLNKLHTVNANDNIAMSYVMEVIEEIAEQANCAVLLAHHTSKPGTGVRRSGNADTSQGAAAVVNGSRFVLTLNAPEDDDVSRYSLTAQERRLYLRLDDAKMNRVLDSGEALWIQKVSVNLWTGGGVESVGALQLADMHAKSEFVRNSMAETLHSEMQGAHVGAFKIKEAVQKLMSSNPIFGVLEPKQVEGRIKSYLAEPCVLPNGARLHAKIDGKEWIVTM